MFRRVCALALALVSIGAIQSAPASAASSLPIVSTGRRPGPAVLYSAAPKAPQLENHDARFKAKPLLVSGAEAYVAGEYLYQDYIYDDGGASTQSLSDPLGAEAGGIKYPTNTERYANNAADIVEFRVAPGRNEVAYRITLNTLLQRDSTIVAIAFDTDRMDGTGLASLPGDPGAPFPGTDQVITAWGTGATHGRSTSSGTWKLRKVPLTTDLKSNQMTIVVPRAISDPRGVWRTTVAVGLNAGNGAWLKPQDGNPSADTPGGASMQGSPAIFNLAFRYDEPIRSSSAPPDEAQAEALAAGEPTRYARDIDFGLLDRKSDRSNVPRTGTIVRLFPSRLLTEGGKDSEEIPQLRGQLQQYSLYVPSKYRSGKAAGFTLMLHSLGQHHWQYNGSTGIRQVGEQRSNIVMTPHGRGDNGWYQQEAEYDVFEAWNDVARHYSLDANRTAVSGYSMGGYGTYRFGSLWPDLFGKAFSTVGPPGEGIWIPPLPASGGEETNTNVWLENTRNVPYLNVVGLLDELVPYAGTRAQNMGAPEQGVRGFEQLGYRYRFVTYPLGEHFTIAALSYDTPYAVDFLGDARVDRDPRHVTFTYAPGTDVKELGLVHDHAYWVSEVKLADKTAGSPIPKATVDAFSHASGLGDPAPVDRTRNGVAGEPWYEIGHDWAAAPKIRKENKVTLKLDNVRNLRIDLTRTGVDVSRTVTLDIRSTHAATISVAVPGAGWIVKVPAGERVIRLR